MDTPSPNSNEHISITAASSTKSKPIAQLDRLNDYIPSVIPNARRLNTKIVQPTARKLNGTTTNATMDLLPYCTHPHMSKEQVIGLSDVAGNLREVVLLALRAGVDDSAREVLASAVGGEAAEGIVDFFREEWCV
ncbi:hypothetical protein K505DRAFT_397779 [Melanomma pulvis-pyrius CBS 109.77]|uniref:Uncharacterized protein n=1 Tax=Melanomma pulvis-pyrius CBS 109.77 TaxID=1314802 RepID=A0A6A6XMQ4_9PLEO|nr:hypothetical protein K505DRAFT_397779 [Melanomma pulvis-pyrius CBS 109.77]